MVVGHHAHISPFVGVGAGHTGPVGIGKDGGHSVGERRTNGMLEILPETKNKWDVQNVTPGTKNKWDVQNVTPGTKRVRFAGEVPRVENGTIPLD